MPRVLFNPFLLLREDLRQLQPYQPHDYPGTIKLDANENPYPLPEIIQQEAQASLKNSKFNRYPDPTATELRRGIARYAGVGVGQIMVGNGSDELILNLIQAFGSGGKVIITDPTFGMYRIHSCIAGAEAVTVSRREDFSIDAQQVITVAGQCNAKLVMLCSPNNPTGNATPLTVIEEILGNVQGIVVVDQAYIEFGGDDCVALLSKYPNLVILRTFSKAFGLAGLRLGYLLAHPGVVKELKRVKQPYNVNVFSQATGVAALNHLDAFKKQWQQIITDRDKLAIELAKLQGLQVLPSVANFILVRYPAGAEKLHQKLLSMRILVRYMGQSMPEYLRIGVGTTAENQQLLQALQTITREVN